MTTIQAATYPIHFENNGYDELSKFISENNYSSLFILVDENTLEYCYPRFMQMLGTKVPIEVIQIEAGEVHKNIETCVGVWNVMTELGADRKSLLITLGGGVITDLGGFVASTFKRGIDFVNVPTTLLSMVDASVGGKTGVDLGVLKNQIGVFANPELIIIDPAYLHTVTPREIRSGSAEIIKYGMTHDIRLFNEIKDNANVNIVDLIHRSIEIKNEVVLEDPKEQGVRKVLNWGHTIGHAVESYFLESEEKEALTHGEAIAVGMICEAYISNQELGFSKEKMDDIKVSLQQIFGIAPILTSDVKGILEYLIHDKKNVGGAINFVLLEDYENFKLNCTTTQKIIVDSLSYYSN